MVNIALYIDPHLSMIQRLPQQLTIPSRLLGRRFYLSIQVFNPLLSSYIPSIIKSHYRHDTLNPTLLYNIITLFTLKHV